MQGACETWESTTRRICTDAERLSTQPTFLQAHTDSRRMSIARVRRILAAYALSDPEIGYCQGMSDLATPLLEVFRSPGVDTACRGATEGDEDHACTIECWTADDFKVTRCSNDSSAAAHVLLRIFVFTGVALLSTADAACQGQFPPRLGSSEGGYLLGWPPSSSSRQKIAQVRSLTCHGALSGFSHPRPRFSQPFQKHWGS